MTKVFKNIEQNQYLIKVDISVKADIFQQNITANGTF